MRMSCGFLKELNSHGLRYINVLNRVYAKYRTTMAEAAAVVGNRKREIDYLSHAVFYFVIFVVKYFLKIYAGIVENGIINNNLSAKIVVLKKD